MDDADWADDDGWNTSEPLEPQEAAPKLPPRWQDKLKAKDADQPGPPPVVNPTPFVWSDPALLPPREFVYGRHLIRRYVSATVAPGGFGKTSLQLAEAVDMATARGIFHRLAAPLRVWFWCGEDPRDEIERRVHAILLQHHIRPDELGDRLFLDSGRDMPIRLVTEAKTGLVIAEPMVDAMVKALCDQRIDVFIPDPFIATHRVSENDNSKIEQVVDCWKEIADRANVAVDLTHHVRKGQMGQGDYTAEDARGAKALIDATRSTRVLNIMSESDATNAKVPEHERRLHFRVDNGKANLVPPSSTATWRRLMSVDLGNGDQVQAVVPWTMPGLMDGFTVHQVREVQSRLADTRMRADPQAKDWLGVVVAEVLSEDLEDKGAKARVGRIIKLWIDNGALISEREHDSKKGREVEWIRVGTLV